MDRFTVKEEVVLVEASPLRISSGVELLDVRVNYVHRESDGYNFSWPGSICTKRWPPKGFGPAFQIDELRLHPKDHIAVTFYSRAKSSAQSSMEGLRMVYRSGNRRHQQTTESTKVVFNSEDLDPSLPIPSCQLPSIWIGDETDQGDGQSQ